MLIVRNVFRLLAWLPLSLTTRIRRKKASFETPRSSDDFNGSKEKLITSAMCGHDMNSQSRVGLYVPLRSPSIPACFPVNSICHLPEILHQEHLHTTYASNAGMNRFVRDYTFPAASTCRVFALLCSAIEENCWKLPSFFVIPLFWSNHQNDRSSSDDLTHVFNSQLCKHQYKVPQEGSQDIAILDLHSISSAIMVCFWRDMQSRASVEMITARYGKQLLFLQSYWCYSHSECSLVSQSGRGRESTTAHRGKLSRAVPPKLWHGPCGLWC